MAMCAAVTGVRVLWCWYR